MKTNIKQNPAGKRNMIQEETGKWKKLRATEFGNMWVNTYQY